MSGNADTAAASNRGLSQSSNLVAIIMGVAVAAAVIAVVAVVVYKRRKAMTTARHRPVGIMSPSSNPATAIAGVIIAEDVELETLAPPAAHGADADDVESWV